ncbi:MAG: sugar-binding domain-containing protein, partial [bacterium]
LVMMWEENPDRDWKFQTGDDEHWKEQNLNDSKWRTLTVPGFWEVQGFPDYNGYAWYRLRFRVPDEFAAKRQILLLGNIDDFDETYLNGKLVGKTGTMGRDVTPNQSTEYSQLRAYTILPGQILRGQENVLAVRVFDGFKDGGIYRGPIGLVSRDRFMKWKNAEKSEWFDWFVK